MIDSTRRSAETPITLDEWSAALSEGALGRVICRVCRAVARAEDESRMAGLLTRLTTDVDLESALMAAGISLAVAMLVHLLLLMLAQPYPYPGHSMYWLPAVLLVGGVALTVCRRPIAAAWRERTVRR